MTQSSTPKSECPKCHYEMSRAACLEGDYEPSAGDLSVCLNCGTMLEYNDILVLKLLTDEVWFTLDIQTIATLDAASKAIKARGPLKK